MFVVCCSSHSLLFGHKAADEEEMLPAELLSASFLMHRFLFLFFQVDDFNALNSVFCFFELEDIN